MLQSLDALLLLVLSIPIPLYYRIWPMEGTPYILFGVFFLAVFGNVLISFWGHQWFPQKTLTAIKTALLVFVTIIVVAFPTITAIVDRHKTAPIYGVHDIILQQEAAMRYLVQHKNPYKETYFGTPMEEWDYGELGKKVVNPALYHFVMPPWYVIAPFFIYPIANRLWGFFDGRMLLLLSAAMSMMVMFFLWKKKELARYAIPLIIFPPAVINYFIEGRSDAFALAWFLLAVYCLTKKRFFWSSIVFGLALISKQTIWFAFPFYCVYLWILTKKQWKKTFGYIVVSGLVAAALTAPFFFWDPHAFFESTVSYLSGNSSTGYPVSGYGLGMVLYSLGVIKDIHAYYPFSLWQLALGMPTLVLSLWYFLKKPSLSRFFFGYGATLLVIWYVSRYFNNSHLSYLANIFVLGGISQIDEEYEA